MSITYFKAEFYQFFFTFYQKYCKKVSFSLQKEFLYVFDFLPETTEMWRKAGELSYLLRQKGKVVGLSDCYISVTASSNNAKLLTLDRHFEVIGKETGLNLYEF